MNIFLDFSIGSKPENWDGILELLAFHKAKLLSFIYENTESMVLCDIFKRKKWGYNAVSKRTFKMKLSL